MTSKRDLIKPCGGKSCAPNPSQTSENPCKRCLNQIPSWGHLVAHKTLQLFKAQLRKSLEEKQGRGTSQEDTGYLGRGGFRRLDLEVL